MSLPHLNLIAAMTRYHASASLAEPRWNGSAWFITVSASVIVLAGSTCRLACCFASCSSGWRWFWLACTLAYRAACCNEGRRTIPLLGHPVRCMCRRKWVGSSKHFPPRDNWGPCIYKRYKDITLRVLRSPTTAKLLCVTCALKWCSSAIALSKMFPLYRTFVSSEKYRNVK